MPAPATSLFRRRTTWLIGLPILVAVVLVGGSWLYLNVLRDDPPVRLSLDDATTTTTAGAAAGGSVDSTTTVPEGIEGTWMLREGSQAGYRAKEVLFGQSGEAVGRTSDVSGVMKIAGTTVTSVDVSVLMESVTSDETRRDDQFRGRIMDVATYPTATFKLTKPIELGSVPEVGVDSTHSATGELTLRGVRRAVTFDLRARRLETSIDVSALIPISFDDFKVPDASGGPARVGRNGELELLLVFER